MKVSHSLIFAALYSAVSAPPIRAQSTSPADRVLAASKSFGLIHVTAQPWHLVLDVALTDAKEAKSPAKVEAWQDGARREVIFTFGEHSQTRWQTADGAFVTESKDPVPTLLRLAFEAVMQPGPSATEVAASTPVLLAQTINKTPLDCIELTTPQKGTAEFPLGLFPGYCMLRGTDDMRITSDFSRASVIIRAEGKFAGALLPTAVALSDIQMQSAEAKVTTLSSFKPADHDWKIPATAKPERLEPVTVAEDVMNAEAITKTPPEFPPEARANRVNGVVTVEAIIGADGRVRSLRPTVFPSFELAIATVKAVRQWVYKPHLVDGVPVPVKTTVTVKFNYTSSGFRVR